MKRIDAHSSRFEKYTKYKESLHNLLYIYVFIYEYIKWTHVENATI